MWISCIQDIFWLSSKESACNEGAVVDANSISGSGRSPAGQQTEETDALTVHEVEKSWTRMSNSTTTDTPSY